MYLKVPTVCLGLFWFSDVCFQSVNLFNRFNSPESVKRPSSFCWKCYFVCDVALSLWKTKHSPVVAHVTCESSHLGTGWACEIFLAYTCTEPGKFGFRDFCEELLGWVAWASPLPGSLCGNVVETWSNRKKKLYSEYKLLFHALAVVWDHSSEEHSVPFLLLSTNTLVSVLFTVNSVWE